jgi:hypothetical protein
MKLKIWTAVTLLSLMAFTGCAAKPDAGTDSSTGIVKESDASAKISAETADQLAAQKKIENVKSIILKDIDGNKIDKAFSEDDIQNIVSAYNESTVQDTSYVAMITGSTMVITLEDDSTVTITSYGDENNIVAAVSTGESYHLSCPAIASILLEKAE